MGEKPVLKSNARGRIARRAAAAGAVSAGVLLGGLCAVGASADTKTVSYTCTPGSGSTATAYTGAFTVTLTGPVATATVGTAFTATLTIAAPATAPLPAPSAIGTGKALQLVPSVVASVSPTTASTPAMGTPTATAPVASMTAGASLPPLPVATITVTPSTGATSIVLTAKDFTLNLVDSTATGTGTPALLYTCQIATGATPAAATIPVAASGSASASNSASTTPTPTASTPRPTRTVYETVTAKPSKTRNGQVTHTPGGGAATGGGGEIGPDGRVLVLTGTGLMLAAATGGLMIRARRRPVRH
ncbi:hypothetical protein [Microbispora sp. NPDC049125]|uniref:hypothetical protein n=1 Tax=Microbispora sp. NPDC049125 TaxID=3154929 RepID=UPI003465D29C